jgi:hypothetical protein
MRKGNGRRMPGKDAAEVAVDHLGRSCFTPVGQYPRKRLLVMNGLLY